ncbi:MAG: trypsin-like peptidase domain-containing protein, partial [Hyphomicrobiales bacterium]|nr:trypsin-like peptidase domain-containing protein [Hyphomicrobiales bacterium]
MPITSRTLALAAAAVVLLAIGASAETARVVPTDRADMTYSFSPIVKRAAPAVVNVYAERMVARRSLSPMFDDPFFRRFFGGPDMDMAPQRMQRSLGSGVIIAPDGVVMTNHHVIKDADQVRIALADKREFEAEIILADSRSDLAVLQLKGLKGELPFLEFGDSDALEVGDLVLAIGDPFGVGQTVTSGIVSATARTHVGVSDFQFFIQTDA